VTTLDANGQTKDRWSSIASPLTRGVLQQSFTPQQADPATLLSNHTSAVPKVFTFNTSGGRLAGYIQFIDHVVGAQDDLISAFQTMKSAGVQDLVLDLRANGGGFLYIALTAASMITGPSSDGQVFERLRYNDKRQTLSDRSTLFFSSTVQFAESRYPSGTALPQLSLQRVFVLTSPVTCSASESIINSLRGINVEVIQIGTTDLNEVNVRATCGKPYGFIEKDNCGLAYFPIEFQGSNAKDFGDYTAGFRHTCEVADDGSATPGTSSDPLFNAAQTYIDTGACPAGTKLQSSSTPKLSQVVRPTRSPSTGRLLLPSQR
jgi:hypothetical protein